MVTSVIIRLIFSLSVGSESVQCISSVYKVRYRCLSMYCVVVSVVGNISSITSIEHFDRLDIFY